MVIIWFSSECLAANKRTPNKNHPGNKDMQLSLLMRIWSWVVQVWEGSFMMPSGLRLFSCSPSLASLSLLACLMLVTSCFQNGYLSSRPFDSIQSQGQEDICLSLFEVLCFYLEKVASPEDMPWLLIAQNRVTWPPVAIKAAGELHFWQSRAGHPSLFRQMMSHAMGMN